MKTKAIFVGIILSILFVFSGNAQQDDFPVLKGPYLGQKPPGLTPEVFAPDIITTSHEVQNCLTISPDGKEIYWGLYYAEEHINKILFSKYENNKWTEPQFALTFQEGNYKYDAPFFSPDGKKLYFISRRPAFKSDTSRQDRVWVAEKALIITYVSNWKTGHGVRPRI